MATVTLDAPDGPLPAWQSTPSGEGPWPGVVVVHEIFGLNDDIRAHCARFAAEGFLALAPDLYGRGNYLKCLVQTFRQLGRGEGPAHRDLDAARTWLADRPDCTGRIGIVGFCMGGGFALLMAPRGYDVAAPNYGPVPEDAESLLEGACPVVASYGGRDTGLKGHAARLDHALGALGVPHDVKEYPEAGHSFLNRQGSALHLIGRVAGFGYHAESARDAWQRILAMFRSHLDPEANRDGGSA